MGFVLLLLGFLASVAGSLCGMGGGVIIKPFMDVLQVADVAAISFMSSCAVLFSSLYSVWHSFAKHENSIDLKKGTKLAVGAAVGGVLGNVLFKTAISFMPNPQRAGAFQAILLGLLTIGTLVYTLNKNKITTMAVNQTAACVLVGLLLGILSSFLGIGGGPFNVGALYYFFSMTTKQATQSSLYIILFSQITNIGISFITGTVPGFMGIDLALLVCGGLFGAAIGARLHSRLHEKTIDKLFMLLLLIITAICGFNTARYWQ